MVSIIIPAYNCENYIAQCLDSLLQQEETSVEIIVINDGSKDRTGQILDKYACIDARLKVLHVQNGGPSRARNIGLDNATGEWILFVDADDWVDYDILARLQLNERTADITFFGFKRCYNNGRIEECIPKSVCYSKEKTEILQELKTLFDSREEYFGYSVNKIYKHSIISEHNIRFKEGLHVREDEVFALTYCQYISSIQTIAFAPYNYRILDDSLSHCTSIRNRNYRLLIKTEQEIMQSYRMSAFKSAVLGRLFKYYLLAIIESLQLKKKEKFNVITDSIIYYRQNKKYINVPKWQRIVFGMPFKALSRYLVYVIFSLRN